MYIIFSSPPLSSSLPFSLSILLSSPLLLSLYPPLLSLPPQNVDELDYPVRSYYIYAETDNEMNTWIDAINAEIQPLEGGGGRRGPKVDIKAFDEVRTVAMVTLCGYY